jgi:hypothetical protein
MPFPPLWIAPRDNQDWIDEDTLSFLDWLEEHINHAGWARRLDRSRATLLAARDRWAAGERVPVFNSADAIAFYAFQARAYAADRTEWFEPEAYRVVPITRRLGQMLPVLRTIDGVGERVARLLTDGRRQPDDGLYELLVAGAYAVRGWKVAFEAEQPGLQQTPDLYVSRGRSRWAAECKRVGRGEYAAGEGERGRRLAAPVHSMAAERGRSVVVTVEYQIELGDVPDDYLVHHLDRLPWRGDPIEWADEIGRGAAWNVVWGPLNSVIRHDDILFGSSRMIELVTGAYLPYADHDMQGRWTASQTHPFHAADVHQLSLVSWLSGSSEAARRKARHFKGMVGRASRQLPGDRPGVVHVGYETGGASPADTLRHMLNVLQISNFDPGESRLRWVYANYMSPERTTAENESAALTESTAFYKVGRHNTRDPLPRHFLFGDDHQGHNGWHLP